jgi:hypothetical protein
MWILGIFRFKSIHLLFYTFIQINKYCTDRAIYLSESHDHRWGKTIDEGGPLLSISSIKLGLLKERYCSDMPSVVSVNDGTSHEIQIPSNEPQQKTYFQQTNSFHWLTGSCKFNYHTTTTAQVQLRWNVIVLLILMEFMIITVYKVVLNT